MLFPKYKVHHLRRVMALVLGGLALLVLSGYVLGGCAGGTDVTPSSQVHTPITQDQSSTPPPFPTEQPTAPRLLPSPEQTAPIIPTPEPTLEPTLPPPPPTFTAYPTFTRLPTPTPAAPILLIDPVSEPKGQREELEWFASTGHTIRGIFLDYWTSNGGAVQFGYPLTEEFVEVTSQDPDNKQLKYQATQYFEHALFTRQAEALQSDENGSEIQTQTPTQTQVKVVAQSGISGKHVLQQSGYATGRYPLFGYASDFSWLSGEMELYGGLTCLAQTCPCAYFSYDQGKSLVQFADRTWWSYAGWGQLDPTVGQHLVVFGRLANTKERPEINCPSGELPVLYIVRHAQMNPMP